MKLSHNERGSAILLALALFAILSGISLMVLNRANTDTDLSFNQVHHDQAFWLADAGAERAVAKLKDSSEWRDGYPSTTLGEGQYSVTVTDGLSDSSLDDRVRVVSLGQRGEAAGGVEVILGPAGYHSLYDYAVYAGNCREHEAKADTAGYVDTLKFGGSGASADLIDGDVFFNGHIKTSGEAEIDGSAEAAGQCLGKAPGAGAATHANYLPPPDLRAMHYRAIADYTIDASSPWDGRGRIGSSDPRHIFVRNRRIKLKPPGVSSAAYTFSNNNYFWGDPWEGSDLAKVSVSKAGNNKVYCVDGNLWIKPEGSTSQLIKSPAGGTHITVVVQGNIYFAGNLLYDKPALDGIAFVAMTAGESFEDKNNNGRFDDGEAILHDDGDGLYEGPAEGSGNVYFGSPNGGALGPVYGFIYADNDLKDCVTTPDGTPLDFEITGTLSAGNDLDLRRDSGGKHAPLRVHHDTRLRDGLLDLPGLPSAGGAKDELVILSWREL